LKASLFFRYEAVMAATLLTPGQAASKTGEFNFGRARSLIRLAGLMIFLVTGVSHF
jgi:hypothetical protein